MVILQSSAATNNFFKFKEKREITFMVYHIYKLHDNRYCRYLRHHSRKAIEMDCKIL